MQDLSPTLPLRHFRSRHPILNRNELSVHILKTRRDAILDRFLDLLLDEFSGKRANDIVDDIVLCIAHREFERVHFDLDAFDFEYRGFVLVG